MLSSFSSLSPSLSFPHLQSHSKEELDHLERSTKKVEEDPPTSSTPITDPSSDMEILGTNESAPQENLWAKAMENPKRFQSLWRSPWASLITQIPGRKRTEFYIPLLSLSNPL
ncbi:hypothetical protein RHMOL_Rhmol08G0237900 [Rhododendron molle]|uniref:Uncharacterized protein n=1 Tax=Rhododendron molle TaxID=49168 RepID=A0ACC0MS17_RHOML|nr:hypothetical protein RHMOL_Rhmol08G0237900 [Rhododendron molle]